MSKFEHLIETLYVYAREILIVFTVLLLVSVTIYEPLPIKGSTELYSFEEWWSHAWWITIIIIVSLGVIFSEMGIILYILKDDKKSGEG